MDGHGDGDGGCCFPEEIMFEILTRVPAKDLIRFKVVCKTWYLLISDTKFVEAHLHWASTAQLEVLLIPNEDECLCDLLSIKMQDLHFQTERLKSSCPCFQQDLEMGRVKLHATCNGLLLFEKSGEQEAEDTLILYNPVTRQCNHIPCAPKQGSSDSSPFLIALVHDDFIDIYSIFSILSNFERTAYGKCFTYKMGMGGNNDWEMLEFEVDTKPDSDFPALSPLLFVKNDFYWVTVGDNDEYDGKECDEDCISLYLFSLNVSKEIFKKAKIPLSYNLFGCSVDLLLSNMNGSVCVILFQRDIIYIRVFEDEIKNLWSELYRISLQSLVIPNEPSFIMNLRYTSTYVVSSGTDSQYTDDLLDLIKIFINHEGQLFLFDLKKETLKQIGYLGKEYREFDSLFGCSRSFYFHRSHKFHFDSLVTW